MPYNYILKDKTPIPEKDLLKWGKWMENADRHIAITMIGDIKVSTVFLGVDHNFAYKGSPILFETMVFGGKLDGEQERYSTWEDAEKGHEEMVKRVRETETH